MSARRKTSPTKRAPATDAGGSLPILLAMLRTDDGVDDFRGNVEAALKHLPAFLRGQDGFSDGAVLGVAEKILDDAMDQPFWREARALRKPPSLSNDDVSTLDRYAYLTAGASFALGFVAGMRLGGGR